MEQNNQLEDIIEDVTVEELAEGLELEQESTIVSEEQVVETEEVTLEEETLEEEADKGRTITVRDLMTEYDKDDEGWKAYEAKVKKLGVTAKHDGVDAFSLTGPWNKVRSETIKHYDDADEAEEMHSEIKKSKNESIEESDEKEMKEAIKKRKFKKLTKKEFIKRIKSLKRFKKEEYDDEELSQEEEDAWEAAEAVSDHFTYDSSEMPIAKFKKYAYKFVHIMDDGVRPLSTFKSMSDEKLVAEVEHILSLGIEFDKSPKYGARVIIDEEVDSSDISRLVESEEGLTEEFKEKAAIIFEAAVTSKIREEKEKLAEQFETQLSEQTAQVREDLAEKVDNYLTYVVESWVEDNKVAIESGLRSEIAENFIGALKTVFVENYIEVPESKKDLVSDLEVELAAIKESATQAQADAAILNERVEELVREKIISEAGLTLADTQAAKLANLVQDVEFVSEDTFRNKVETIKEAYFSNKDNVKALEESSDSTYETIETIVEGEDFSNEISPSMAKYLTAVSRLATAKG